MSLNNIGIVGNAVRDPESRTLPKGSVVTTIRIAHNDPISDKVLYIDVDTWDKQAEFVSKYVKKGSLLGIAGKLKMDEWTDKEGKKQTKYAIVADRVHFIGGKKKSEEPSVDTEVIDDAAFAATAAKAMAKLRSKSSASTTYETPEEF